MNRLFFILFFVFFGINLVFGQETSDIFQNLETMSSKGTVVTLSQEDGIADMVKIFAEQKKKLSGIEGWRVQLYSGGGINAKKEAQDVKGEAMLEFPNQKVYLIYDAPFWRVRVGDFRDKSESLKLYYQLKKKFVNCYPVRDDNVQYKGF
ncbi:MAG: SPOR domain-containing protein [Marinilabiliaceae bacterium]|nr:SPOR domain-containing protein [Marinilabiliaceae bacterium]